MGNYRPNDVAQMVYFSSSRKAQQFTIIVISFLLRFFFSLFPFHDNWNIADISLCRSRTSSSVMMCFSNSLSSRWVCYFLDGHNCRWLKKTNTVIIIMIIRDYRRHISYYYTLLSKCINRMLKYTFNSKIDVTTKLRRFVT